MKILLGAIIGFIIFNLFVGYIMWDITWFTNLGELTVSNRTGTSICALISILIGAVIGQFYNLD